MRGRGASRARCERTPALVLPTEDARSFYGQCLVCGKIGPKRQGPEAARRALLSGSEEDADEEDSRYASSVKSGTPLYRVLVREPVSYGVVLKKKKKDLLA